MSEAASNCTKHAYTPATVDGTVELTFWTEPRSVCIEIVDHGAWRTPSEPPTECGRGIEIMQRLIRAVLIHYDSRGTRVLLSHPLPGPLARIGAEPDADGAAAGLAGGVRPCRAASHRRRGYLPRAGSASAILGLRRWDSAPDTDDGDMHRLLAGLEEFLRKG